MDNTEPLRSNMQATFELHQQVKETTYVSLYNEQENDMGLLDVIFVGKEKCRRNYGFERRSFPVYIFECVLRGKGDLQLDGTQHTLRKGSVFVYGPEIPCNIMTSKEDPLVKGFVAFRSNKKSFNEWFPLEYHFIDSTHDILGFGELVEQLFETAFSATECSSKICCRYLEILFFKWMEHTKESRSIHKNSRAVFLSIKKLIDDNYLEFRRIDDISSACSLTPSYISRLFKQYFHMTPYNYLLKKKMEYALDLLSNFDLSVAKTASLTGFEDPFHFSRVFKTVMHKPPTAFKKGKPGTAFDA